jgi:hypothetical protein
VSATGHPSLNPSHTLFPFSNHNVTHLVFFVCTGACAWAPLSRPEGGEPRCGGGWVNRAKSCSQCQLVHALGMGASAVCMHGSVGGSEVKRGRGDVACFILWLVIVWWGGLGYVEVVPRWHGGAHDHVVSHAAHRPSRGVWCGFVQRGTCTAIEGSGWVGGGETLDHTCKSNNKTHSSIFTLTAPPRLLCVDGGAPPSSLSLTPCSLSLQAAFATMQP